jgi:hypothetical protein
VQAAALAAQPPEVGRVVRVAAHAGDLPPCDSMMTPQPTPQYGQVERVSFMRWHAPEVRRTGPAMGRVSRPVARLVSSCVQVHLAVFHLDAEKRGRAALVGRLGATVAQADGPVVQRAGHAGAEHDALAQRAALVRAAVQQRKHLVLAVAEHGHVHALGRATRREPSTGMSSTRQMGPVAMFIPLPALAHQGTF